MAASELKRREDQFFGAFAYPQAGADQHGVLAPIGEKARQSARIIGLAHHDGGKLGGIDLKRVPGRGDRDKPGTDAERAAGA